MCTVTNTCHAKGEFAAARKVRVRKKYVGWGKKEKRMGS